MLDIEPDIVMRRLVAITAGAVVACAITLAAPAFAQAESIELSTSVAPTEDVPMTITASGEADGSHRLFVYVGEAFFSRCAARPTEAEGTALAGVNGEALGVGDYTQHYSYTPTPFLIYTYRLCGYLDTESTDVPDATAEDTFTVGLPSASVSFEVHPNPTIQNQSVSITASGTTEVARNLYVYVDHLGPECAGSPESEIKLPGEEPLANGQALNPGSYVEHYAYTPTYVAVTQSSYSLCGYLAATAGSIPDAWGSASFTVISLQSIVETEQHAAEEQAAKKAQEAAAKKHAEEVSAANRKQEEEAAAKKREQELAAQIPVLLAGELTPSGKAAKIASLLKGGGFTLTFKALEAGTAVIDWYEVPSGAKLAEKPKPKPVLVAAGQRTFSAAGTAKIKIKLTSVGKRLLDHARKLRLTAKGTFTPTGKTPVTATKVFVPKY